MHVHPEGHLGCLPLLLSTNSSAVATHSRKVYPLMLLFAYPILSRCVPECRGLLWCFRLVVISAGLLVDSLQLCPCDECLVSVCQALIQAIRSAILKISKRAPISSSYMRIWKLSHFSKSTVKNESEQKKIFLGDAGSFRSWENPSFASCCTSCYLSNGVITVNAHEPNP